MGEVMTRLDAWAGLGLAGRETLEDGPGPADVVRLATPAAPTHTHAHRLLLPRAHERALFRCSPGPLTMGPTPISLHPRPRPL